LKIILGAFKIGFSSETSPRFVLPSVLGRPKLKSDSRATYIGDHAQLQREILELKHPIQRGIVINWNDMDLIWYHLFNELKVNPKEHPVLLTDCPLCPKANREKMTQIMFETYNVPAMDIFNQSILALYASNRVCGIVLDSGEGVTHSVPIGEGYAYPHAIIRSDFAGADLSNIFAEHLIKRGYSFNSFAEKEIARDIKERFAFVAFDFEQESACFNNSPFPERKYKLPDGQEIAIGSETFQCPEVLFQPSLIGMKSSGVHEMLVHSVLKCDGNIQKTFFENVVLAGGSTLLRGFVNRLQRELNGLAPSTMPVKIFAPPHRKHSAWIGGSILASIPAFQQHWITIEEYEESGPSIIHRRTYKKMGDMNCSISFSIHVEKKNKQSEQRNESVLVLPFRVRRISF
jgi:actin-related protein